MAVGARWAASVLAALIMLTTSAGHAGEPIRFEAPGGALTGVLMRPAGAGPFPAVLALHGCGGLYRRDGRTLSSRHDDWADRLVAAGFLVMFADSFSARGLAEICRHADHSVTPRVRADDARAALTWLAGQPGVDRERLYVIGWSHGAMSLLWLLRPGFLDGAPRIKSAIAFYPGCREIARQDDWRPSAPLTVLAGAADDWTDPAPCAALSAKAGFRFIAYPGAYHGFDAPASPVRLTRGLARVPGGTAHVGTDPAARAAAITEVMDLLTRP